MTFSIGSPTAAHSATREPSRRDLDLLNAWNWYEGQERGLGDDRSREFQGLAQLQTGTAVRSSGFDR